MNYKLAPTSAMVLFFAEKQPHPNLKVREYLSQLDLSSGEEIAPLFKKIWEPMPEIIKDRKFIITQWVCDFLDKNPKGQLVILGAGVDSLSLEMTTTYNEVEAFDIDIESMESKKELLQKTNNLERIHCLTADIADASQIREQLAQTNWDPQKPTVIVVEGLSYYMEHAPLWKAIEIFKSPKETKQQNCLIFEYFVPFERVKPERRQYPAETFKILEKLFSLPKMKHYTEELIEEKLTALNGKTEKVFALCDIQKLRLNQNDLFPERDDGWLEVALARL